MKLRQRSLGDGLQTEDTATDQNTQSSISQNKPPGLAIKIDEEIEEEEDSSIRYPGDAEAM